MAQYTESIRELFQRNLPSGSSLEDINTINDLAKQLLFTSEPALNVISDKYRDNFVTGFALHFFLEEFGLETLPLWRIALNEKLFNNGSYINLIYENLDKEIFANYQVRKVDDTKTNESTTNKTGTVNVAHSQSTNNTTTDKEDISETVTLDSDTVTDGTGTVTNAKTGSDTKSETGSVNKSKTGHDDFSKEGSYENKASGQDSTQKTGSNTVTLSGSDVTTGTGDTTDTTGGKEITKTVEDNETVNSGTTQVDKNVVAISYDTPQGSLQNLRVPGGDATGMGVAYATGGDGQTYNYMSGAAETDATDVTTDNTTQTADSESTTTREFDGYNVKHDRDTTDTTRYGKITTEQPNTTDISTYGKTDTTSFHNYQEINTYHSGEDETSSNTDTMTYNSTDTETRGTKDTTTRDDKTEKKASNTRENKSTGSVTGSDATTNNLTDKVNGKEVGNTEEVSYALDWEILHQSQSLLNSVWDIFNDLFIPIFN